MSNTPIKNIRRKCLQCCNGSTKAVKYCTDVECPLWRYRFGQRPKTAADKYGKQLLTPELIPDPNIPLDTLP